jgi:NAD(P)-dependent dehydrogenase (short-subunit alcohol dehydrogenase family)/uncharacterized damage-inducible protein DinB
MRQHGRSGRHEPHGRVAVVTGAARGLGRVIAATLADEGYSLVLADVTDLAGAAADVESRGVPAWPSRTDVSSEPAVRALADGARDRFGRVDVLVNNAGVSLLSPAEATTAQDWRRVIDINLTGPFLLCREFGAQMLGAGTGSIVNVASIAGLRGVADRAAYNASKHGLVGLTYTLAAEWGGRGVRVQRRLPGLDQDRDGRGGSGQRRVHRHRYRQSGADGAIRLPGGRRVGGRLPGGSGPGRVHQRGGPAGGRGLGGGRQLDLAAAQGPRYRKESFVTTERPEPPLIAGEREMMRGFLNYHRATLAMKCDDLSDEDLRRQSSPPSTLSLLGLVQHMAEVERTWFRRVINGEDIPFIWSDKGDFQEAYDASKGTRAEAFAIWEAEMGHSRRIEQEADSLDVTGYMAKWGEDVSLRLVMHHMIHEYARHNGHADFLREAIDGTVGA